MFKKTSSFQNSFFGNFAYQQIIERHKDHLLIRLLKCVDLSFIEELVKDCYCADNGRPAYQPVMMFKILFLQTLYNQSDVQIIENIDTNILFRYFTGLALDDSLPDRSLLGKFKDRLGEDKFNQIFNQIINLAKNSGLLDQRLRLIDCTAIKARVDLNRCQQEKTDDQDHHYIDRSTPDPEASTGHKSTNKKWYGYKSGILLDPVSEMVTAVETTTASVADTDQLETLVAKDPHGFKRLCGDKGFQGHQQFLQDRKIINNVIRRDNMKIPKRLIYHLDKKVRPCIERKFAECKLYHGLGKARYWGRFKIHLQSLLIYLTANLKKLVNFLLPINT